MNNYQNFIRTLTNTHERHIDYIQRAASHSHIHQAVEPASYVALLVQSSAAAAFEEGNKQFTK